MNNVIENPTYEYKHMRITRRPLHTNKYVYRKTTNVELHFHNAYELLIIESGRYNILCPRSGYKGSGPCIIIFNLGMYHGILRENCEEEPYSFYVTNFHQSVLDKMPEHPICSGGYLEQGAIVIPITAKELELFIPLMERLARLASSYTYELPMPPLMLGYFMTVLGYVYELIIDGKSVSYDSASDEEIYISQVIKNVLEAVDRGENILVSELAEEYHVSVTKLSKDFKKITNVSIKQMIDTLRLERAKKLLKSGLSTGVVAERCGFSSSNYFIQFFKRYVNMSPSEYRQTKKISRK